MTCGFIYKIEFPNGKHYIGKTNTSLKQRQNEHKNSAENGKTNSVYKALRKYNMVDTFELVEIDTADTIEELCEMEIGYILMYNSHYIDGNGYNMTYGGEGVVGYVFTEEDKQKMSESQKKYYKENPEAIQKMSEIKKEYYEKNPDKRLLLSEITKKQFESEEARQKQSEKLLNFHKNNPQAKLMMSEIKKEHFKNHPEAGKEHSERMTEYYEKSPEAREEMSKIVKGRYENPEYRKKCSDAQKKRFENEEELQKNSERIKKYHKENPEYRKHRLDKLGKNKPFDIFTTDGTFIKTFTYQYEAKEYLQKEYNITSIISICQVLNGNMKSSAGFVFKYK
jgi:hypothetical protein